MITKCTFQDLLQNNANGESNGAAWTIVAINNSEICSFHEKKSIFA